MNKRFLVVMAVLILIFVGFVVVKGQKDKQNNQGNSSVQPTEHKSDAKKKKVTLSQQAAQVRVVSAVAKKAQHTLRRLLAKKQPKSQIHSTVLRAWMCL